MEVSGLMMKLEIIFLHEKRMDIDTLVETISNINLILKHMSDTIDVFKNFYKTDKDKEKVSISTIFNSIERMIGESIKEHQIQYQVVLDEDEILLVYKNDLTQVLINIINNAIEVLSLKSIQKPKILIKLKKVNNLNSISLSDNGGGISVTPIQTIFEPFYTDKKDGTGIGLFMSHLIVENRLKGKIVAENNSEGATFTITLP